MISVGSGADCSNCCLHGDDLCSIGNDMRSGPCVYDVTAFSYVTAIVMSCMSAAVELGELLLGFHHIFNVFVLKAQVWLQNAVH